MKNTSISILLKSLLAGWVAIIFGTSIIIYLTDGCKKLYHSNKILNSFRCIWEIADEIGPTVKLSIILVFTAFIIAFRVILMNRFFFIVNIFSAILSVLIVLTFLPENLSRGYGISLQGVRFDSDMVPKYLIGAILGGFVYSLTFNYLKEKNNN